MLMRDQWKPGLLFACLFLYFKLTIFVCDNSRQFIEEAYAVKRAAGPEVRGIKPLPFPHCFSCPLPPASGFLCLGVEQRAGSERGAYTENLSTAQRVDVSCAALVVPRGELLSWQPAHPAVNLLPGVSEC